MGGVARRIHGVAAGVRQFLDIGTGMPTADSTHDVAQRAAPESRIVYVDHDPVVISHARALLTSSPAGKTDYIQADLRDWETISAGARRTLDFSRPVGVLLIAVLHFILDAEDPHQLIARMVADLAPGTPVTCRLRRPDRSTMDFDCRHTLSPAQIEWFRAGSALNLIRRRPRP